MQQCSLQFAATLHGQPHKRNANEPCDAPINAPGLNTAEAKQYLHRVETAAQQQPGVSWMERPKPNPASSGTGAFIIY